MIQYRVAETIGALRKVFGSGIELLPMRIEVVTCKLASENWRDALACSPIYQISGWCRFRNGFCYKRYTFLRVSPLEVVS